METETVPQSSEFALGLGLTNECNLTCSFCYRDPARLDRLSLEQVQHVLAAIPVRSVNLGTGENGMHPDFHRIIRWLSTQPLRMTITSNGHSVKVLSDEELRLFHDIELSLDYDTRQRQDEQRGAGNWDLVNTQAQRCRDAGVPVTIIAVMMKSNYRNLANVARIAKRYDAPLRINVYQSVRTDLFALTYEEYWDAFKSLLEQVDLISTGEPLVRAMAGLPGRRGGCGCGTVRVTPARHGTAVRVLARERRAHEPAAGEGPVRGGVQAISGRTFPSRRVPVMRSCGCVPRRLRRPPNATS